MADEKTQPNPTPVETVIPPPLPQEPSKPLVPMLTLEQITALANQAQRSQALEAEVAELRKMLLGQAARIGGPTGKIVRVHCNVCGTDADQNGTVPCGHNDFINHLTHGNRMMSDGSVEMVISRQTRVI